MPPQALPSQGLSAPIKHPTWQKYCHFINQQAPPACEHSVRRGTETTDGNQPWCVTCTVIICSCVIPDRGLPQFSFSDVTQPPHTSQLSFSLVLMLKSFSLKSKLNLSCSYLTPIISIPVHYRQKEEITLFFLKEYYVL